MKVKSLIIKSGYLNFIVFYGLLFMVSCNGGSSSTDPTKDSTTAVMPDSSKMMADTTAKDTGPSKPGTTKMKTSRQNSSTETDISHIPPPSIPNEEKRVKGYAMVYCPPKMITHVPSIIDAQISKSDLSAAYSKFIQKVQSQNPNKKIAGIEKDIKGDSIDIYENVSVAIEFDGDDFKQVSRDNDVKQSFNGRNELEWDWVIKPLHSAEKSIIIFKFYYRDPTTNQEMSILEKTISISVQVDARGYLEKWGDFLLDDPKTTLTVIVIP